MINSHTFEIPTLCGCKISIYGRLHVLEFESIAKADLCKMHKELMLSSIKYRMAKDKINAIDKPMKEFNEKFFSEDENEDENQIKVSIDGKEVE